ncbi:MAG: T9SS type A sorting domain-containing protein, partial [Algicola sp.]|nr:T9SS type A sorting domain-containing protein [Algicola sp.]
VQNNLFSFFEDNCSGIAVNISDPVLEGDTCSGTATYTIDVFDACGNLNNNCNFTINWEDTTPPNVIDNCPTAADFGYTDVQCQTELPTGDAAEQAFVQNNISAFYDDNCSGIAEVNISDPVLDGDSCSGTATYTIDLFDACGNLNDNCSFTINWADTTPPNVIDNCPTAADFGFADVQCQTELPTGDEAEQALVQNNLFSFFEDNCSGIAVNISDPVLEGDTCSGTATYTIDVFDACGNLNNNCNFTINWEDTTPPQIPLAPGSLAICEGDTIPAAENLTAYDACQGEIIVSPIETIEPLDNGYNIVRNYTAYDGCGNSSVTTTQIIFVNDLPTITPNEPVCDEVYGSYSVEVQVSEGTLISSAGNVTDNGNGLWSIDDIPNGQNIILTATAGTNCTTSIDIVAPKCVCIELELTYTDVSCFGLDDGTISVEYVSPGATVTVNGMPYDSEMLYEPGVYTVTAYFAGNDNPECIISEEITIEEPVAVDVVVSSTNITCYGANDGTITIESISEGAFYTIKKNGYGADLSGQEFFGPGTYIVEANLIDDASRMTGFSKGTDVERANNPCEDAVIVVISQPDPFECTITRPKFSKQLNCSDTENNQLYANTIGGEGPLEYAWSLDPSSENNYWELPNSTSDSTLDFLPGIGIGHFYLTVTDANGCMTSCEILFKSSCTKKDVLNRGEFNRLIVFDLYPNPSEGKVNVKLFDVNTDKTTVEVFNLVGTLMFSQDYSGQNNKDMVLDLGNLPSQVYYVKVSTSHGSQIKKLIIDK